MYTINVAAPVLPISKAIGCYVDDSDETVFMFGPDDKLTLITGMLAFTQAMVSPS